jgi:hypothetical protein
VSYTVNDKKYTNSFSVNDNVSKGSVIDIRYDPADPSNSTNGLSNTTMGWILFGIGVLVLIIDVVVVALVFTYKPIAAASGVGAMVDLAIPDN